MTSDQSTGDPAGSGPERSGNSRRSGRLRTVAAWTGVGAFGAWALVRLTGADRLPGIEVPAAPLLAVTPYVAAATPLPIIAALVMRRPRAALAAGLVAAGLLSAVVPRAISGGEPDARGPVIRVLTANLLFGEADPARVLDLVRRTGADVLSLQEFPPEAVSRYEQAGLTTLLPYKVIDPRWGAAGSGLYARFPLRRLPALPRTQMAMPRAELTLPDGRRVELTAVHPVPPISSESLRDWKRDLGDLPSAHSAFAAQQGGASGAGGASGQDGAADAPVRILAGDFNATLDHATLRRLIGRGYADAADRAGAGLVPTWGVSKGGPPLTIDHVLVDRRCAVRRVEVYDLNGSDHRAVFAEIRLP